MIYKVCIFLESGRNHSSRLSSQGRPAAQVGVCDEEEARFVVLLCALIFF
jgi:hypothetical protein